ncbi:ABC transporter permease [Litorimonas cladophorae]|uniref:ABC transporter permease n=1 Tax=Litorimonas cladophorae TaxID=1220491 RepID=A0A918KK04_9PROT|nr:DMT family transporter [Litorimonas cladophorae]GGX64114.1 ABC transporter permease [Litorimonas cladophorae]
MSQNINQHMNLTDTLILVTLSILWGGSFFFIEILVDHLPPLTIVTFRVGLAAIALWVMVWALKLSLPATKQQWASLFVIGLLNNALPFCLIVWGQTQISSGLASIFNATTPFFTVLVAGVVLTDERITKGKLTGVIIGLLGTIILIGPEALNGLTGSMLGQLAVIGAALSYACAAAYSRRFKKTGLSPLIIATGQVSMATLILLPLVLIVDRPWVDFTMPFQAIWAILGLAFFSTVIAYILYFRLIASAGATNAALVTFLIPISAILLGVTFLNETFSALQAAGMSLIGLGLLVMDGRIFRRFRTK